ncbi:hypothetical protein AYJ58_21055 [Shewanella sp. Pdp11]|nr:hypothetical protein AYJ58_21055 [Shewanella sp. Pdp11]
MKKATIKHIEDMSKLDAAALLNPESGLDDDNVNRKRNNSIYLTLYPRVIARLKCAMLLF